ncbi:hypothetical protein [Herpetosiphon giganteus]|uniref:hypothetical protein n=1 Tax=Herpetosiphon giganteus TaxID=2029754 RepID=UPI0019585651|nr:hypothetical protein [Herpetosiphon giganteus]MBM7842406.1 hypothetical protein [Herpetosiphon giganteus]
MNNRRLALLMSLCAVLFGFAVAKQPVLTSAKVLLTQTPSDSTIVPSETATPSLTATPCPSYYPLNQAQAPNSTQTLGPTRTTVPTPNYYPCYVHPALVLSGPSQVQVGELFTLSIAYENIGMQHTTIRLNDDYLARFDPPLAMPCKYDQHPTRCQSITLRATSAGVLVIEAQARGESFNNGWFWSGASAKTPLTINIVDPNATPIPTATCVVTTAVPTVYTATPTPAGRQAPQLTQTPTPCVATPTFTPTPTVDGYICDSTPGDNQQGRVPQITQPPCTPVPTPVSASPTVTPIVKELILSAPNLVNVGEAFSLTIQYVNIGVPYTGITLSPTGTVQFDPPMIMPCKFNEHPTHCRTIGLRAVAPGTIEIDAGATGEVPVAGGGWAWGSARARNPITVRVLVLDHKLFVPMVKTQ